MATGLKSTWHRAAKLAYVALLLAAAFVLAKRVGNGVEPGLLALVDSSVDADMQAVTSASAANVRVVVEGTNWADVVRGAGVVRENFGVKGAAGDFLADVRGRTHGLLDSATRALIISNDLSAVREAAEARLFGLAPSLFPVRDDPMLLATAYAESLQNALAPGWSFRDGLPVKSEKGMEHALLSFSLSGQSPRVVAAAMDALPGKMPHGTAAHFSGAAFHAARSASGAEREIGVLSAVSLGLVLLFGWMLFRSASFAPPLAAALCAGGVAAAGALFAAYPRPHVLTFVFGTSLIGLSVDYVYHVRASGGARTVLRPLSQSFATTLVCFAPLLFADVDVLRQMALFAMAGLTAVYAAVVIFGVTRKEESQSAIGASRAIEVSDRGSFAPQRIGFRRGTLRIGNVLRFAVFAAAAGGMPFLKMSSEPSAFYRPDDSLAADERKIASLLSMRDVRMVFVRGASLQEALEREEEAGVRNGLSAIVPSLKRQRENAELIARLYMAEGAKYAEHTGLKTPCANGRESRLGSGFLDPDELPPESSLGSMARTMWTGSGLISPCAEGFASNDPNVRVIDISEAVRDVFARVSSSTWRLFIVSAAALLSFLLLVFRRRAFEFVAPPAFALAATAGMFGWLGIPFTFFTLLSFFVILGLGLDYAIFHRSAAADSARRTVLFAFLTSLAGLGLLSFTAFPVTREMGFAFAFGLLFSYLFSIRRR